MAKGFLPYDVDQHLLLPPDMRSWLPEGHLALFVLDENLSADAGYFSAESITSPALTGVKAARPPGSPEAR